TSSPTKVKGRAFTWASIPHRTVANSSSSSDVLPSTFLNAVFTERTKRSQYPPHHGARGVMYFHSILFNVNVLWVSRTNSFKFRPTSLNDVKISHWIMLSWPRRAKNRSRACKNHCAVRLDTNSRWIARVVIHVKRQIYTFLTEFPSRAYKGPAKSRPVFSKGETSTTLSLGKSLIFGKKGLAFSFLQVTHSFITRFTIERPFIIQYLWRRQDSV
ncbi:hypothetical protein T01_15551, partial [Trichinella spiralis]